MPHQHLQLSRDEPVTDRHRAQRYVPRFRPTNPREFGADLRTRFTDAQQRNMTADTGGFDQRRLIKITLRQGEALPPLDAIPGVELVSQEDESIVLAFASEDGLSEFEARLTTLAQEGQVTRKEIFYAIEDFDRWTPANRTGTALAIEGLPDRDSFILDVELWPLESRDQRSQMLDAFSAWASNIGVEVLDRLNQPSLVMAKVRVNRQHAASLLDHRDVRTVDLPPRLGITFTVVGTDINQIPHVPAPPENAALVAVLDSGITSNHPLIAPAMGDAQGFLEPGRSAADNLEHGHGTFVAARALYGDVEACLQTGQFVPLLRILSGKVFNDDGQDETEFVERAVEEAVRYFRDEYGCRVFNLSYGDLRKVYDGRHVRGLAYTLDRLTRDLDILFVVPTGNLAAIPVEARERYPDYLLDGTSSLLDPATALNVITVGGFAVKTASRDTQRNPERIEDISLCAEYQPSPFTRSGFSIGGAIKPDFVEEAGNLVMLTQGGRFHHHGIGVLSANSGFAEGRPLKEDIGTSYAAPLVAHKAARLTTSFPGCSINLLRATLAVHAYWPKASCALLNAENTTEGREKLLRLAGYGQVSEDALYESLDQVVTLFAEESIGHNKHHFYEVPLPTEFWDGARRTRQREISVAIAYSPEVRTTRLDYRRTKIWFSLVTAETLEEATSAFTHGRVEGLPERNNNRLITCDERRSATLQMSRWTFRGLLRNSNKLFIVVTRQDATWSNAIDELEPYALSVLVSDAENANATVNLHQRISALLQARAQERERARARV